MPTESLIHGLSDISRHYDGFVLDQWGVLHDGNHAYPGVYEVLTNLRKAGKQVVILTNSSKSVAVNERRLAERFGISRDLYKSLVSSAEVMIDILLARGGKLFRNTVSNIYVVADGTDAGLVDDSPWRRVADPRDADLLMLLSVDPRQSLDSHEGWIAAACAKRIPLVCCSADLQTVTPDGVYTGLAAVTSEYEARGGTVINFGKPEPYVYEICARALLGVARDKVLALGDQMWSDIYGAKKFGFDAGLVGTGASENRFSSESSINNLVREVEQIRQTEGYAPDWLLPALRW